MFFFEKKNQKTFIPLVTPAQRSAPKESKLFCFFFSKKKILPFLT
jgi:hypothetical protein